jgi:dsRNA-specific ribonuclease
MGKTLGSGSGSNKKGAEQQAAENAIDDIVSWRDGFQDDE